MLKVDLRNLFVNAHKEARKIVGQVGDYMVAFKIALTDQWKAAKSGKLSESAIKALEKDGWARWTKGKFDRLYFNADKNGILDVDTYKSGNICSATWNGEGISNSEAGRIMSAKCFMNVKDGKIIITSYWGIPDDEKEMLRSAAENSLKKAIA